MIVAHCDGLIVLGGVCACAGGRLFYQAESCLNYRGWHIDSVCMFFESVYVLMHVLGHICVCVCVCVLYTRKYSKSMVDIYAIWSHPLPPPRRIRSWKYWERPVTRAAVSSLHSSHLSDNSSQRHKMHVSRHQASLAMLGWLGDGTHAKNTASWLTLSL